MATTIHYNYRQIVNQSFQIEPVAAPRQAMVAAANSSIGVEQVPVANLPRNSLIALEMICHSAYLTARTVPFVAIDALSTTALG